MVVAFKDIGKLCSDLLNKDFKVGKNTVEVKSKTPNNVTFTPSATKSGDKFAGQLATKYMFPGAIEGEATMSTGGTLAVTLENADSIAKGLTTTLECETAAPGKAGPLSSGKCVVDFKQDLFTCKASYDYYTGAAHAAATTAAMGMTVGACCNYSMPKGALTGYAGALQYSQPEFTLVGCVSEDCGKSDGQKYSCTYYHKVSSDMQVCGALDKAAKKPDMNLTFGCAYKLDKDTNVKAKVDSEGILSASYKQKISSISVLTLAAAVDTVNLSESKHKFGMQLNITP